MSYCIAWKKDKSVYMLAESAISSPSDNIQADHNTFGEIQGLYGKDYVQEGQLKIYKINENIVLGFAGDVDLANGIIQHIYSMIEDSNIKDLMHNIEITFSGTEIELIIVVLQQSNHNSIYHFNGTKFVESERCEIGCGTGLNHFSNDVKNVIDGLYTDEVDQNDYLAMVLGTLQCYSLRNNTFANGVGGTFLGLMINTKIRWFRDLEYYIFDDNILRGSTMSIITRRNSVFSSSEIGKFFILNKFTDQIVWEDLYYRRSIKKSLDTKNAYYYIFYSKKYNVISFLKVNGETQNIHFKRWVRRKEENIFYAYLFNPKFESNFKQFDSSKDRIPTLIEVEVIKDKYMSHNEFYQYCKDNDIVIPNDDEEMDFDFNEKEYIDYDISMIHDVKKNIDFNEKEYIDYDISMIHDVKKNIENYHNLLLADFSYFCDAIAEKITLYAPYKSISISQLNLNELVKTFVKQIAKDEFEKYRIVFLKNKNDDRIIQNCNMKELFLSYSNCIVIDCDNYSHNFRGTAFQIIKNYYLNDSFFHLDKLLFMEDDLNFNNLLNKIIPKFNLINSNPDILLIRNLNGLTNMDGRLRYIVIDYLIIAMLGISLEEYGQLESLVYDDNPNELNETKAEN